MLNFLLREKNAIEYMSDDLRGGCDSENSKVNIADTTIYQHENNLVKEIADMQSNMQTNLKMVIEGLAQVSQAMSSNTTSRRPTPWENMYSERMDRGKKYCWLHNVEGHNIQDCTKFKALDVPSRLEEVRKNFVCFACLEKGHISRRCPYKSTCPIRNEHNELCGKYHHKFLHMENRRQTINMSESKTQSKRDGVMLMVSTVHSGDYPLSVLWDPGANLSLI